MCCYTQGDIQNSVRWWRLCKDIIGYCRKQIKDKYLEHKCDLKMQWVFLTKDEILVFIKKRKLETGNSDGNEKICWILPIIK